jgi:6-pyruvoyltetrahydropterin/6-carboxytetrahydropterin synthase
MSTPAAYTCCKTFSGFPCTHRQWRHPAQCRFVHGYSRSFSFWFRAHRLDEHGFVVDFSGLKELETRLVRQFDHTFLVNADDPLLRQWQGLHEQGALDLRVMDNVGMEASAELVWGWANELLRTREGGRACCWRAEARENEKNGACFSATPTWFEVLPVSQPSDDPARQYPETSFRETSYDEPGEGYGAGDRSVDGSGLMEAP